ncbi:MAG: nucleotide exchange factor GrpE [Oscillospiraceae bacterium]|jgi:molecular chaperone GrpE (heat shock protein)
MVQKLYTEIQEQGRSSFYERCLSCYHNGITPANVKISRPGWFSRNALNIVFAVNYLLMGQNPGQLQSVMTIQLGSLNNLLRDSQAQQDTRYAMIFREAQKQYDTIRMHHFASGAARPTEKQEQSIHTSSDEPVQSTEEKANDKQKNDSKTEKLETPVDLIDKDRSFDKDSDVTEKKLSCEAQVAATKEETPTQEVQPDSVTEETPVQEEPLSDEPSVKEDTGTEEPVCTSEETAIPALLLPILSANQKALNDAIQAQKQLDTQISFALSKLNNPFSQGAVFHHQLLSSLNTLIAYQEECNRILLSNLADMESALCTAQWQGFVEVAALFDAFFDHYTSPERRHPNAMWGDIRAIRQKYTNQLRRQGIEPILPQPGDAFDEELHELSDASEVDIDQAVRITALHTCGYRTEDTVLLRAVVDADETVPDR